MGAVNQYLAAGRLDSASPKLGHPLVREFVLARASLDDFSEVRDLMELSWFYTLPKLALSEDCTLLARKITAPDEVRLSECTWEQFSQKNIDDAAVLRKSMELSWELRTRQLLE